MLGISVDEDVLAYKLDWGIVCISALAVLFTAIISMQVFTDRHPETVQRRADKAAKRASEGLPVAPRKSLLIFVLRSSAPGILVTTTLCVYSFGVRAVYQALDYTAWRVAVYAIAFLVFKVSFHSITSGLLLLVVCLTICSDRLEGRGYLNGWWSEDQGACHSS